MDQIRDDIIRSKNDPDYQRLEEFYKSKSFSEIVGISRREDIHSKFLVWLLNNSESHGLGDYPVKKFLDIVVKFSKDKLNENSDLYNSIVTEDYEVKSVFVQREKDIKTGRLDIYIELALAISDKQTKGENEDLHLKLIIENKVDSKENDDQTERYYNYFSSLKDNAVKIYIYLTPISTPDLKERGDPECVRNEFIQINYQSIVDFLIEPALKLNITEHTRNILNEYLKTLSQPLINNNKNKNKMIMALSENEKNLLSRFWNKNQKLIMASADVIISDENQPLEVRNTAKAMKENLSSVLLGGVYTEQYHLDLLKPSEKIKELYFTLKEKIKNLDKSLEPKYNQQYIAFVANTNRVVNIRIQKNSLKIWLKVSVGLLYDPKNICRDVSNKGNFASCNTEIEIRTDEELEYIMDFIKKSLEINK